jgi:hypothetical protein
MSLKASQSGGSTIGGEAMAAHINEMMSFTYTTHILATPERVWQGRASPTRPL